jgi:hypothetical protein
MTDCHIATPGLIYSELEWALLLALHMFFRFLKIIGSKAFSLPLFSSKTRTSGSFSFKISRDWNQGYYQCWAVLECPPDSQTGSHNEN